MLRIARPFYSCIFFFKIYNQLLTGLEKIELPATIRSGIFLSSSFLPKKYKN